MLLVRSRPYFFAAFVFVASAVAAALALAGRAEFSARNLSEFVDPFVAKQMTDRHVPGAAFVFVRDGRVVHAKAYGLANLSEARKVDVDRTAFPVGSLSKPVTADAVMQLPLRDYVLNQAPPRPLRPDASSIIQITITRWPGISSSAHRVSNLPPIWTGISSSR